LLLASLSLVALPVMPVQASLVADKDAADTMTCLKLLFTDSEAHAAECGGPFEMDKGKDPLVKGTYSPGCNLAEIAPLTIGGAEWRLQVAELSCCYGSLTPSPAQFDLTPGEVFRIRVAGC
jgi:hypothetical protein